MIRLTLSTTFLLAVVAVGYSFSVLKTSSNSLSKTDERAPGMFRRIQDSIHMMKCKGKNKDKKGCMTPTPMPEVTEEPMMSDEPMMTPMMPYEAKCPPYYEMKMSMKMCKLMKKKGKTIPAEMKDPECMDGYKMKNGKCYKIGDRKMKPMMACPMGAKYMDDMCYCCEPYMKLVEGMKKKMPYECKLLKTVKPMCDDGYYLKKMMKMKKEPPMCYPNEEEM